jgi:hypothetical protein
MWTFTKYGFFSAVCTTKSDRQHRQPVDTDRIMVRARVRNHLDALRNRFADLLAGYDIKKFAGTDYAYRLFVSTL